MKLPDDGFHRQWKRKLISTLCEWTLPFQLQLSHSWWFGRLFYNVTLRTGMSEWLCVATLSYSSPVNLRHLTCLLCCHLFYLAEKIQSVTLRLLLLDLNWKRSAKRCSAESHTLPMSWGNAVNAEKMWRQNRTLQISQIRYVMIYCLKTKQKNAKLMYWSQRI